jgi:hypothetical protein
MTERQYRTRRPKEDKVIFKGDLKEQLINTIKKEWPTGPAEGGRWEAVEKMWGKLEITVQDALIKEKQTRYNALCYLEEICIDVEQRT